MRKRKHLREPGRCQPGHHGRSQFLDSEYIHVVLPQNANDRGRVGRTALGVHGEQAQPERVSQQILFRAMVLPQLRNESA